MALQEIPIRHPLPELQLAIRASVEAGNAILEIYGREFKTHTKADDSPVTEADLASNRIIRGILSDMPHMILSEEDSDDRRRLGQEIVWIVDPLDGTADFIDRTGEFTVMIAMVKSKRPVLGVINWPAGGTVFAAQHGAGAFKYHNNAWERITVSDISELAECRMVGSRHHLSEREKEFIKGLGIREFASVGSSLKAARIGSGEAEAYLTTTDKMKEWDSAASCCIITEAGGRMTDMLGNDITYNNGRVNHRNGILVTNGLVHDKIVKMFRG